MSEKQGRSFTDKAEKRGFGLTIFGRKVGCLPTMVLLIVLALGMLILAIGFYLWLSHETKKRLDIGYGATTNPDFARLEIGDKVFSIPKNHIWSRENWRGGKAHGVNMYALLPDFEPRTKANQHVFDKPGSKRKVNLLLSEHNIAGSRTSSTSMTRKEIYERIIYDYGSQKPRAVQSFPGPYGLTLQKLQPSSRSDELYVGHKQNSRFYWVTCSPEGLHLNPSCETHVEYSAHVTISYSFPKEYLSKWDTVDDGVINLITQFETNAKPGAQR